MSITVVLLQMIKLFLIICIGFVLYKIKMIDDHTKAQLTKILLYVTTPALIIDSFVKNMGSDKRDMLGELFVIAIILYAALPVIAILLNVLLRIKKPLYGIYMFMPVFSNVGFMGFPVADALFGSEGVFYAAVFNCIFNISVFTLGVFMINYGRENEAGGASGLSLKKILNPGVLCSIVAVVIFLLELPVPEVIMDVLSSVGGLTSPLAMIIVGASLAMMNIKEMFGDIKVYIYTIIRQIALPLLSWPVIDRFIENDVVATVTLIMTAMPVANTAVLFATEYGCGEKEAAKVIFLTTLAAIVSIPVVMWVCVS